MAQYEITNEQQEIDFECTNDETQRILQNAKNLLMCRMGEVPFDRQRGLNPAIFDMPVDEIMEELLPELDRVMLWEPGVEVASASVTFSKDGEIIIHCIVELAGE